MMLRIRSQPHPRTIRTFYYSVSLKFHFLSFKKGEGCNYTLWVYPATIKRMTELKWKKWEYFLIYSSVCNCVKQPKGCNLTQAPSQPFTELNPRQITKTVFFTSLFLMT